MEKKNLIALIAVLLLGAGAIFVTRSPEKGQRQGPPPRPVAAIKAADVSKLEVTNEKQEQVSLEKRGETWHVTKPSEWAADASTIKSLIEGIERLTFADTVTDKKDKHEELGVAEGKAQRLVVKNASGNLLADLLIGKSVAGYTMVRPAGKDEVWQATGLYGYMLNREPKGWREHAVFQGVTANDVEKLSIESAGHKLVLEKGAAEGDKPAEWKIAEATGDAPKTANALDAPMVTQAVQALASLRAADFADDKKPEELGLDKPAITITATAKGQTYTLLVGNITADEVYVKNAAEPTLYSVKKYAVDRLAHKPADFRDKTLAQVKEDDLQAIDLTTGGETSTLEKAKDGSWKLKAAKVTADESKIKPVVSGFESLVGSGFAEERDPAKTGLAKPTGTLVLRLKDKSTITLKVGALTKDQSDYHVQKVGSPDVLLVKKYVIDRVLKKPTELGSVATAKK